MACTGATVTNPWCTPIKKHLPTLLVNHINTENTLHEVEASFLEVHLPQYVFEVLVYFQVDLVEHKSSVPHQLSTKKP